jgi:hypothetical protein
MYDAKANQVAADLIKNFLNYMLMQDVCPEFNSNVMAARHVCDTAPTELQHMHQLMEDLPGPFNRTACSLFCEGKVADLDREENFDLLVQFRLTALLWPLGKKVMQVKEKILQIDDASTIHVVSTTDKTYQVIGIERPRRKHIKSVQEHLETMEPSRKLAPAGVIRVLPAIIGHGWGNMPGPEDVDFSEAKEEEFILEDDLLAKFEVGMKLHMTVCELNAGLCLIKEVYELRVSFDEFLPQHLMAHWKEPAPNERPPPSIHDKKYTEEPIAEDQVDDED